MIYLVIIEAISVIAALYVILRVVEAAQDERRELEDRLLAVCHPIAMTQVASHRGETQGEVNYVDEESSTARSTYANAET